ncbi:MULTISPECIES: tripartite tricarboxylate transporter substrate binding protein [unclassified Variovorax]|uniref:tripartite tricarboxylate transporter substrate binding protein n=1 Tax=unclassified Variovorax TaxID=663243 RepID=UPI0025791BA3|nr:MULTISPECIES: tripartite tricarboxylate transporter substrate binding protein [unclassified Variovorax]MDM0091518.1 tripartite tricarboxylate transporter substrate binding protein [Variovorax sp. J22G40]MDM0148721.1 tripartite tricarboxylate transporter substrate binding protein [Variovorax sp. J2P1-31]
MPTLSLLRAAVCALFAAVASAAVMADNYPTRPIRVIVPYSAGGSTDVPVRTVAAEIGKALGQGMVIDNRPGMGAMIGAEAAAKAAPDGYTLLAVSNPQTISGSLYKLSFDPVEAFVPVALITREPCVVVVNPELPVKTFKEFVEYVKARPGMLNFGSSGNGSNQHLFAARLLQSTRLDMVHVPYKGAAPAVADLMGGQVSMMMPGQAAMIPLIKSGKLRVLAVTSGSRSSALPDVPTLAELGYPEQNAYVWTGLVAPKGTPDPVLGKLREAAANAMSTANVKTFVANAGLEASTLNTADFHSFMRNEALQNAQLVKQIQVKID